MFGKRGNEGPVRPAGGTITAPPPQQQQPVADSSRRRSHPCPCCRSRRANSQPCAATTRSVPPLARKKQARSEDYYDTKSQVFSALIDTIDLSQLAKLDTESAREEIRDIVNDIITIKNYRDVDLRAGRTARGHLQRRSRLRPARAAARPRRHLRHHGQRRQPDLHRSRRQDRGTGIRFRDNTPASVDLPAHRQPGRPPRR